MRISPIISFKGIKGGLKKSPFENIDVYNYYPYKNETKEETDRFIKRSAKTNKIVTPGINTYDTDTGCMPIHGDSDTVSYSIMYEVGEKLPFTEEEHNKYYENPSALSFEKRIEIKNILQEIRREKE